jgi:hypothetical protein
MVFMKNKFFGTVFSFFPGAGHMYMGLMRQGIEIMGTFFVVCGVNFVLDRIGLYFITGLVWWLLPVIYCFSFFDSINKLYSGREWEDDDVLFFNMIDKKSIKPLKITGRMQKVIAIVCIILGVCVLIEQFFLPGIITLISSLGFNYYYVEKVIYSVIVAFILISFGCCLIIRTNKNIDKEQGEGNTAGEKEDIRESKEMENEFSEELRRKTQEILQSEDETKKEEN